MKWLLFWKRCQAAYNLTTSLPLPSFTVMVSISVWTSYACTNQIPESQENKKMEPVSSTSRRERMLERRTMTSTPEISTRGSLILKSLVSDTSRWPPIRQGGREMAAPRPYETYPIHQPTLFTTYILWINFSYIPKCSSYSFHVVLEGSLIRAYNRQPRMRFLRTTRLPRGSGPVWNNFAFRV